MTLRRFESSSAAEPPSTHAHHRKAIVSASLDPSRDLLVLAILVIAVSALVIAGKATPDLLAAAGGFVVVVFGSWNKRFRSGSLRK